MKTVMMRWMIAVLTMLTAVETQADGGLLERYIMTNLNLTTGLPSNNVNDIFVDSKGFVWISCYGGGAVRYDGYMYMRPQQLPHGASISNSCKGFAEDRYQRLWIAYDEGVMVVDMTTMNRTVPAYGEGDISRLLSKEVVRVYCDSKGALWHVARDSIFRYTFREDGSVAHISSIRYRGNTPDVSISDIDQNGTVWINIENGLFRLVETNGRLERRELGAAMSQLKGLYVTDMLKRNDCVWISTNQGLYVYNAYTHQLRGYHPTADEHSLPHDFATALATASDGRLLVGTLRGLCVLDEQTDGFLCWNSSTAGQPMPSDFIHSLQVYGHQLWIGTETAGIIRLSPKHLLLRNYVNEPGRTSSLSPHPVNAMYVDGDGTLWVGTVEGGLNRRTANGDFEHWTTHNSALAHNSVSVLEADSHGQLWIGTWGGGICRREGGRIERVAMPDDMVELTRYIGALAYDERHDALWIGSNDGVFLYDLKTGQLSDPFEGNRNIRGCIGAHIDRDGLLWMGCLAGVCVIDLNGGDKFQCRHLRNKLNDPESPVVDKITCFCETKDGTLWLGSNGYGLYRRRVEREGEKREGEKEAFEVLTTDDGLANNSVKGIVEDVQGRLWITTANGLSVYDPAMRTFINYGEREGLLCQQFYWNSAVRSPEGTIYLGSVAGLTEIRGENTDAEHPVHLTFTRLLVDNQEVTATDNSILDTDISQARLVRLHESNKSFAISFSALTYENDVQGRYKYRMRGFEDDWVVLKSGENAVRYTSLKPGTYTFEVVYEIAGSDVSFDVSIDIEVTPYFWKSWWFMLILAILALSLAVLAYKRRVEVLRRREAEKLLTPIRKVLEDSDNPARLQSRIKNILDNQERYSASLKKNVQADEQEMLLQQKPFMERVMEVMEQHYTDSEFGVTEFCDALGMSRSVVSRRLNAETGQSAGQFIRGYRLNIAKEMLTNNKGNRNIAEIAYKVGFNDPKYFTRCFTKMYSVSPSSYVDKNNLST